MSLSSEQRALLDEWLPGAETVRDHSWRPVGTTVLELAHASGRYIVKAGDATDHHLAREVHAHRTWLRPWTERGRAPELAHADPAARLLVTGYLPGELVEDTPAEADPESYRQAGELLAVFHAQYGTVDETYTARERAKTLACLAGTQNGPHRIDAETTERLRTEVEAWPAPPVTLVPTHGDWQPRNWLLHRDEVRVIDFGRAALRPAGTDLGRLAAQQFRTDPALEDAFLDGYGSDPRNPAGWHRQRVVDAIATTTWARLVGDDVFEQQGHRMIAAVLADLDHQR